MTKAQLPIGKPVWYSRGHSLSTNARDALVTALGFDASSDSQDLHLAECLRSVEYWLGFYPGGVLAIDHAPATSVYIKEIKAVRDNALEMFQLLNSPKKGVNPFTRDTLNAHFEEAVSITGPEGVAKACTGAGNLLAACNSALQVLAKEKPRGQGRKKAGARERVLANLVRLYGVYSNLPRGSRTKNGFAVKRSSFEQGKIDFVRAAFTDIREDKFTDDRGDRKWAALIQVAQPASATVQQNTPRARKKAKK